MKRNNPELEVGFERRVDLKNHETSELRLNCSFLDQFASCGKADTHQCQHRSPSETTDQTVQRLLNQVEHLLGDFQQPLNLAGRLMALQGLALLGEDLLLLVRENAPPMEKL